MTFDFPGYDLKFVQKSICKDGSSHLFSYIYKFYSPITKYKYIIRAEYHEEDVFGIKFYVQQHSKSDYKYSMITNKGDMGNILITCLKVVPMLLSSHPEASFGFVASRTVDIPSKKVEQLRRTQRYNTYTYIVSQKIGDKTFEHIAYEEISSYLLINRNCGDTVQKETAIIRMFQNTYNSLLDIV